MADELFSRLAAIGDIVGMGGGAASALMDVPEPEEPEHFEGDGHDHGAPAKSYSDFDGGTMTEAKKASGGPTPGAKALQDHLLGKFTDSTSNGGIYANRNVRGGTSLSVHAEGRAGDVMVPVVGGGHTSGNAIASYLEQNADRFGIQRLIWNGRSWNRRTREWVAYNGQNPHKDHVHWEITPEAAARPDLYAGGGAPAGKTSTGAPRDTGDLFSRVKSIGDIVGGKPAQQAKATRTQAGFKDVGADMAKTFSMARRGQTPRAATSGAKTPTATVASGQKGEYQRYAIGLFGEYGWSSSEASALIDLVQKESGWNPAADNPNSNAAGLFQKITSLHGPLEKTWQEQIRWGLDYIKRRYGTPSAALAHWLARKPINGRDVGHWY